MKIGNLRFPHPKIRKLSDLPEASTGSKKGSGVVRLKMGIKKNILYFFISGF
jgi:hypothetical protein